MDIIDFRHKTLSRMVQFTAALDRLLKALPPSLAKNKLQDQLGRSGSSVGANFAESGAAESAKDFVHKLSIALKEAEETDFWLSCLCVEPKFVSSILPAFRYLNTEAQRHRDSYCYDDKIPGLCFHPFGEIGV